MLQSVPSLTFDPQSWQRPEFSPTFVDPQIGQTADPDTPSFADPDTSSS